MFKPIYIILDSWIIIGNIQHETCWSDTVFLHYFIKYNIVWFSVHKDVSIFTCGGDSKQGTFKSTCLFHYLHLHLSHTGDWTLNILKIIKSAYLHKEVKHIKCIDFCNIFSCDNLLTNQKLSGMNMADIEENVISYIDKLPIKWIQKHLSYVSYFSFNSCLYQFY